MRPFSNCHWTERNCLSSQIKNGNMSFLRLSWYKHWHIMYIRWAGQTKKSNPLGFFCYLNIINNCTCVWEETSGEKPKPAYNCLPLFTKYVSKVNWTNFSWCKCSSCTNTCKLMWVCLYSSPLDVHQMD